MLLSNGKQVEIAEGSIHYPKKITEPLRLHTLSFAVYDIKDGKIEAYPALVTYKVE